MTKEADAEVKDIRKMVVGVVQGHKQNGRHLSRPFCLCHGGGGMVDSCFFKEPLIGTCY
jgi:hypothetical protein